MKLTHKNKYKLYFGGQLALMGVLLLALINGFALINFGKTINVFLDAVFTVPVIAALTILLCGYAATDFQLKKKHTAKKMVLELFFRLALILVVLVPILFFFSYLSIISASYRPA